MFWWNPVIVVPWLSYFEIWDFQFLLQMLFPWLIWRMLGTDNSQLLGHAVGAHRHPGCCPELLLPLGWCDPLLLRCALWKQGQYSKNMPIFTSAFSNGQQTGQPVCTRFFMLQASWKAWAHAILITILASSSSGVIWQSWESQATWRFGSFPGHLNPTGIDLLSICTFNAAKWYCVRPYSLPLVSCFLGRLTDSPACNPTFLNSFNTASLDIPSWLHFHMNSSGPISGMRNTL